MLNCGWNSLESESGNSLKGGSAARVNNFYVTNNSLIVELFFIFATLNTQHSTLNTQHSTLNTQHSTLN